MFLKLVLGSCCECYVEICVKLWKHHKTLLVPRCFPQQTTGLSDTEQKLIPHKLFQLLSVVQSANYSQPQSTKTDHSQLLPTSQNKTSKYLRPFTPSIYFDAEQ